MGHVINPLSYRLYNTRYWNNNWSIYNKNNYSYLLTQDVMLDNFFKKILIKHFNSVQLGLIFLNTKVVRYFDSVNIYLYVHDSLLDLFFFNFKKNKVFLKLRKKFFKKISKRYRLSSFKPVLSSKKLKILKKRTVSSYSKRFMFTFLKNKILRSFWYNFKTLLYFHLSKFFRNFTALNVFILGLSKKNVNANIISEFFLIRLRQFYTIWEVLKNVNFLFKGLMRRNIIRGYKITCSGRFSRKQRTTYSWKSFGSLGFSSVKSRLDYSYKTIALKYSSCTIKVWVRMGNVRGKLIDFII